MPRRRYPPEMESHFSVYLQLRRHTSIASTSNLHRHEICTDMGLIHPNIRMLAAAQRDGFSFDRIATIGRQQLFVNESETRRLQSEFQLPDERCVALPFGDYCEPFLKKLLDCQSIDSIDYSRFEGASVQHDMNQSVPASMDQQYDAVIDGGSLEHIFNFPVAISNCMRMTKVGGCVMIYVPANNHCGHGLYQFSPEVFFRIFQSDNGFAIEKVVLIQHAYPGVELSVDHRCYEVIDPATIGRRVGLVSPRPTMMMVLARRIADGDIFSTPPLQSDYQRIWHNASTTIDRSDNINDQPSRQPPSPAPPTTLTKRLRRIIGNRWRAVNRQLPPSLQRRLIGRQQLRDYGINNKKFYRPWIP